MRIATWNINSIRIRLDLVKRFCEQARPDILCLQEIKVEDHLFPLDALRSFGFEHLLFSGQKSYHGVAILSRLPLERLEPQRFIDKDEKRHIAARLPDGVELHNFYVPAGGDIPDPEVNPKFKDKLAFVDAMTRWSQGIAAERPVIILGDFNIAPREHDVWSHKQLLGVVSHTPVEVEKLSALQRASQWIDSSRHFVPDEHKLYSWWSYRARDWLKSNRGRRLDHIWITPALRGALKHGEILAQARGWDNPSDHVPVLVDLGFSY